MPKKIKKLFSLLVCLLNFGAMAQSGFRSSTLPTDPPVIQLLMSRAGNHITPNGTNQSDSLSLTRNAQGDVVSSLQYVSDSVGVLFCNRKDTVHYGQKHRIDSSFVFSFINGSFPPASKTLNTYTSGNKILVSKTEDFLPFYSLKTDSFFYTTDDKLFLQATYVVEGSNASCSRIHTTYGATDIADTVYYDSNCDGIFEECKVYTSTAPTDSMRSFLKFSRNGTLFVPFEERKYVYHPTTYKPLFDSLFVIDTAAQRICVSAKNYSYSPVGFLMTSASYAGYFPQWQQVSVDSFTYDAYHALTLRRRVEYNSAGSILKRTRSEYVNNSNHVPVTEKIYEADSSAVFALVHSYTNYYQEYLYNSIPEKINQRKFLKNPSAAILWEDADVRYSIRLFSAEGRFCMQTDPLQIYQHTLSLPCGMYLVEMIHSVTGQRSTVKWMKIVE
jgi:hypothetical protein